MDIIVVRKDHNCVVCGKVIKKGDKALRVYVDNGSFVGRQYFCQKNAKIELETLLKELK